MLIKDIATRGKFAPTLLPQALTGEVSMQSESLNPDDATLAHLINGTAEEIEAALTVAWQRHNLELLSLIKKEFGSLAWQDCEDIAEDAYCVLWLKLTAGKFIWQGPNSFLNFLVSTAKNDARDLIRKRVRRALCEDDLRMLQEERACEPPDAFLQRMEWQMLKKARYAQVSEDLATCVKAMKPAQRSVGLVMADCWMTSCRWPSNERILEVLRQNEPDLKLSTVIERRREVLAKFRPILNEKCPLE